MNENNDEYEIGSWGDENNSTMKYINDNENYNVEEFHESPWKVLEQKDNYQSQSYKNTPQNYELTYQIEGMCLITI